MLHGKKYTPAGPNPGDAKNYRRYARIVREARTWNVDELATRYAWTLLRALEMRRVLRKSALLTARHAMRDTMLLHRDLFKAEAEHRHGQHSGGGKKNRGKKYRSRYQGEFKSWVAAAANELALHPYAKDADLVRAIRTAHPRTRAADKYLRGWVKDNHADIEKLVRQWRELQHVKRVAAHA